MCVRKTRCALQLEPHKLKIRTNHQLAMFASKAHHQEALVSERNGLGVHTTSLSWKGLLFETRDALSAFGVQAQRMIWIISFTFFQFNEKFRLTKLIQAILK